MSSTKQRKDLVYMIYFSDQQLGYWDCWQLGRGGKLEIESLQNQQPRLVAAKVGRFLSMVVYDNEFDKNKINKNKI